MEPSQQEFRVTNDYCKGPCFTSGYYLVVYHTFRWRVVAHAYGPEKRARAVLQTEYSRKWRGEPGRVIEAATMRSVAKTNNNVPYEV